MPTFPSSPSVGQIVSTSGRSYQWSGKAWEFVASGGSSYTLPTASDTILGGIKIGSGLSIDGSGVVTAQDAGLRALFLPPAPTSLTATAGNAQVSLAWSAPTVLAQTPITDYVVQYSSNSGSTWTTFADGTSATTSATVTGLTNGTEYVFRVSAVNGVGTGSPSAATSSVTPSDGVFVPIPTMTSLTSPSGEVSGVGNQDPAYSLLWQAFDGDANTYAQLVRAPSNTPSRMIQYAFPAGQKSRISGYAITHFMNFGDPFAEWVVYGSDDLSTWTEIDSRSGVGGWTNQQSKQFTLSQPANYRAYRWVFQATADNSGPNQISTLQLTE